MKAQAQLRTAQAGFAQEYFSLGSWPFYLWNLKLFGGFWESNVISFAVDLTLWGLVCTEGPWARLPSGQRHGVREDAHLNPFLVRNFEVRALLPVCASSGQIG